MVYQRIISTSITQNKMPSPKTLNKSILNEYKTMRETWLLVNIKIDFNSETHPTAACRVCKQKTFIPCTDNFKPYSVMVGGNTVRARTKLLKTNKQVLLHFQDEHWESCEKTHEAYFEEQCKAPHLRK